MNGSRQDLELSSIAAGHPVAMEGDIDVSLLKAHLDKTPWERMQANDDALNFAESLRAAMEKRNAKSK